MLDWVIVGGGIHGVHLAARLIGEAGVPREGVRIVDPGPRLLHSWTRCTANTGMAYLRSPAVHHLDLEAWSLHRFAGADPRHGGGEGRMFAAPYDRPSVGLFADHCAEVIARYGLAEAHVRAAATRLDLRCDRVTVALDGDAGVLEARQVLLAVGMSSQPAWPGWAAGLRGLGAQVHHIFEPDYVLEPATLPARVAVIGGGITAAQVALRLAGAGREVHVVSRHRPREHQFDSDPGWLGPKSMRRFSATADLASRRAMIRAARHAGSMPPDVARALRMAMRRGAVQWHEGEVRGSPLGEGVALRVGDALLAVDAVLLATGFEPQRPGGALLDGLVQTHRLPCAGCGYPIVDHGLRWHPRVYVTGPLAELEIGPVARNIAGARRAGDRIVAAVAAG
jgi:cation diffusion facilitator CzcD-associated flavoprotein CzcO